MKTFSPTSSRCALMLSLALSAALPAVAVAGGTREVCPQPASVATGSGDTAQSPLTAVDLVFVTPSSKKPGLVEQAPDEDWANWKLDEIGRFVTERAPKVMRANGLDGNVIVLPAPLPGDAPDFGKLEPSRPALLFAPTQFTKWNPRLFHTAGSLHFSVRLINGVVNAPEMKCRVEVFGQFGFDSVWGALKTHRVDAEWVDARLTDGLSMLAKHGVVKLSGEKVVKPTE
jgi:hypothetical protein